VLLNSRALVLTVLAPESVAAEWKQWEHVPRAAALLKFMSWNTTFLIVNPFDLGPIIP
jgi:hypothetical protein